MRTVFKDDRILIEREHGKIRIKSEWRGEIDKVSIDKNSGEIVIGIKNNNREMDFDENGDYIKPIDKDRDFDVIVIKNQNFYDVLKEIKIGIK